MHNFVIVGYGEIARKAHTPALLGQQEENCRIVALVDTRHPTELVIPRNLGPVPVYRKLESAILHHPEINVASFCTPQSVTLDLAMEAVERYGLHVLLEKPPGDHTRLPLLLQRAQQSHNKPITVFTAYHSTAPPGLPHIQEWIRLHSPHITHISMEWRENVQKWHPGQEWVTTREGLGVLDILFNPLSLLVYVLPAAPTFVQATLMRPANWESPIAGNAQLQSGNTPIHAEFDWNYRPRNRDGPEEIWNITFTASMPGQRNTTTVMRIQDGGAQVYVDNEKLTTEPTAEYMIGPEYVRLYERFFQLIKEGSSYMDSTTPRLVQEILEHGTWTTVKEYDIHGR
jgi:L-arabinose 1-dehydrogenase